MTFGLLSDDRSDGLLINVIVIGGTSFSDFGVCVSRKIDRLLISGDATAGE
jgi:hypothetical protein